MINILLKCSLVLYLAITLSLAFPSPTDPYGGTVWKAGDKVTIKWEENNKPPHIKTGITIQLMTGPDLQQIPLMTVVDKISKNTTSYSWTAPSPNSMGYPSGKIYFLMFSDSSNPSYGLSWTTRFTIEDDDPKTTAVYTGGPWTITGGNDKPTASGNSTDAPTTTTETTSETTSETTTTTDEETTTTESTSTDSTTTEDAPTETETELSGGPSTPNPTESDSNPSPLNTQNPFENSSVGKSNLINLIGSWSTLVMVLLISSLTFLI